MLRAFARTGSFRRVPIYEYACRSCEHRFETIQRASEEPLRDCPECGDATLKKLLSAPVFRLKGGGWYETDFKSGDKRNVADGADSDRPDKSNGEDKGKEKPNSDTDGAKAPKASEAKSETGNAGSKGKPAQEAGGTKASSTGKATNGKSSKSSD